MGGNPSRVRILGPLAAYRDGLVEDLLSQGYTPQTSALIARLLAKIDAWLVENGLRPEQFTTDRIEGFLRHRREAGYKVYNTPRGLQTIVGFLRRSEVIPAEEKKSPERTPLNELLGRYETYLVQERSLCPRVVRRYRVRARNFLTTAMNTEALDFRCLTAAEVSSYILGEVRTSSVGYAKNNIAALRSFLRFLHIHGELPRDLSGALPAVANWRLSGLPKFLTTDETNRLLAARDRRTHAGCRDYAVLRLMTRLGLRAGEVASLTLDDIDWSRGVLVVRGKGGRQDPLPLPQDVGEAIVSYLRRGRPHSCSRMLFLGVRAPYQNLNSGTVAAIVLNAGNRCGIPRVGSHRLRHTAATQMLGKGASLREIGQVLRQYSVDTTAIYAKVDRDSLRTACRPWPGARP